MRKCVSSGPTTSGSASRSTTAHPSRNGLTPLRSGERWGPEIDRHRSGHPPLTLHNDDFRRMGSREDSIRWGDGLAALAEAGLPYACMSRRIEIELTSKRADGSFTWRAAGAKQPKGDIESTMVPANSNVGDVLKVDIDKNLDGISIVAVVLSKDNRVAPARLEILGSKKSDDLVTVSLAEKGKGRPRSDRGDRPRDGEPGRDRDHAPRRREGGDRPGRRPPTGDKPER